MSYDCRYGVKVEGANDWAEISRPELDNPTYNLRDIFVVSMAFDFCQCEWYLLSEMLPRFERAVKGLKENPERYRHLEPENKWGTVESAIKCFENWIEEANEIMLHGCCNVSFDYIWWRW